MNKKGKDCKTNLFSNNPLWPPEGWAGPNKPTDKKYLSEGRKKRKTESIFASPPRGLTKSINILALFYWPLIKDTKYPSGKERVLIKGQKKERRNCIRKTITRLSFWSWREKIYWVDLTPVVFCIKMSIFRCNWDLRASIYYLFSQRVGTGWFFPDGQFRNGEFTGNLVRDVAIDILRRI